MRQCPGRARRSGFLPVVPGVLSVLVSVPAGLEITDIGRDYILGIVRDDLDVEQVRLYRIRGRESGAGEQG